MEIVDGLIRGLIVATIRLIDILGDIANHENSREMEDWEKDIIHFYDSEGE